MGGHWGVFGVLGLRLGSFGSHWSLSLRVFFFFFFTAGSDSFLFHPQGSVDRSIGHMELSGKAHAMALSSWIPGPQPSFSKQRLLFGPQWYCLDDEKGKKGEKG